VSYGQRFLRKMNTIVTVEPRTGTTGNGTPAYGPATYHRAYLNGTGELFRTATGQQIVSSATLYLSPLECNADGTAKAGAATLSALPENSRVSWPDPSVPGGVAHPVLLKVNALTDQNGLQMWQLHS
jgi:hypothetical protein